MKLLESHVFCVFQKVKSILVINRKNAKDLDGEIVDPGDHNLLVSKPAVLIVNALVYLFLSWLMIFVVE